MKRDALRRHGSVFMLSVRACGHWFLLLLLGMVLLEGFFISQMLGMLETGTYTFEQLLDNRLLDLVFKIIIIAQLVLTATCLADRNGHTTGRLSVGEGAVLFWQTLYSFVCYLILWGVQLLLLLVFLQLYLGRADPSSLNHQSVVLLFYSQTFLHTALPLAHTSRYLANFAQFFLFALLSALMPHLARINRENGGRTKVNPFALAAISYLLYSGFASPVFYFFWFDVASIVIACFALLLTLLFQWSRRDANRPDEEVA